MFSHEKGISKGTDSITESPLTGRQITEQLKAKARKAIKKPAAAGFEGTRNTISSYSSLTSLARIMIRCKRTLRNNSQTSNEELQAGQHVNTITENRGHTTLKKRTGLTTVVHCPAQHWHAAGSGFSEHKIIEFFCRAMQTVRTQFIKTFQPVDWRTFVEESQGQLWRNAARGCERNQRER
jgi:hypothetical protein